MNNTIEYILKLRDQFSQALKGANDQLKDVEKQAEKTQSSFNGIGSVLGRIGGAVAVGALAKKIFDLGVNAEQTRTSFEVMLGSVEHADYLIGQLKDFAARTPFDSDLMQKSAKTLLQFGIAADDIMPTISQLGDVSGGNAQNFEGLALAFGQVKSAGRLMGQEVLQMINAGFNPLQEISRTTGKSMAQLKKDMENGKISFEMVAKAMETATSKGGKFFGMMDKQSQTVGGRVSTLIDNLTELGRKIAAAVLPTIGKLVEILIKLVDWVDKNSAMIKGLAVAFGVYWVSNLLLAETATLGFAGALRILNTAMLTLQANPFIAILAGVVGGFVALKSAYDDMISANKEMHATAFELQQAEQGALKWLREKTAELQKQKGLTESMAIDQAIKAGKSKLIQDLITTKGQFERAMFTGDTENQIKYGKLYEQTLAQQKLLSSSGLLGRVKQTIAGQKAGQMGDGSTALDSKIGSVVGTAPKVFNININKLVEQLKVETTTLKESAIEVEQQLTKVLINALNNAQIAID